MDFGCILPCSGQTHRIHARVTVSTRNLTISLYNFTPYKMTTHHQNHPFCGRFSPLFSPRSLHLAGLVEGRGRVLMQIGHCNASQTRWLRLFFWRTKLHGVDSWWKNIGNPMCLSNRRVSSEYSPKRILGTSQGQQNGDVQQPGCLWICEAWPAKCPYSRCFLTKPYRNHGHQKTFNVGDYHPWTLPSGYLTPWKITMSKFGKPSMSIRAIEKPWRTVSHNQTG